EDRPAAPVSRPLGEVLEGGPERAGIGVVGVVDDEPAAGQGELLSAPRRQADSLHSLVRTVEWEPESRIRVERRERGRREMALREGKLQLDLLPVHPQARPALP